MNRLFTTVAAETSWEATSLNKSGLTSIEITPYGFLVGQKSDNCWENPYNGIFFSGDFGDTWREFGLRGYGITDVKSVDNRIYATAYYSPATHPGGLYYSENFGETWKHLGDDFHATTVEIQGDTIYLGTEQNGLWISRNNGITWEHSFSYDWGGPKIEKIYIAEDIIFLKTNISCSYSKDGGKTWEYNTYLAQQIPLSFLIDRELIYAGTQSAGLLISKDRGETWQKTNRLKGLRTYGLIKVGKNVFAITDSIEWPYITVYSSTEQETMWADTGLYDLLKTKKTEDFAVLKGITASTLFVITSEFGLYKKEIAYVQEKNPFLGNLWKNQGDLDFVDKLTSFFDHEYPLLGYGFYTEPKETAETTLNFLGQREKEPTMYYSSHNGYDFALSYGTEIIAPASGIANYYYCGGCGHSIKIDHQNGYETTYMHFQKNGLIATKASENRWVSEGTVIGKVGMTGNTTGPHLHFQVKKDTDGDGSFADEYPNGMTDPFGWKNNNKYDPWALFNWEDALGTHQGTASKYLWKDWLGSWEIQEIFRDSPVLMTLGNISVETSDKIKSYPLNLTLQKYGWVTNDDLKYIEGTSFLVEARNLVGTLVHNLDDFITLKINIPENLPENILLETLKIFHWNEALELWEGLTTNFNSEGLFVEAQTNEISKFAVFAETTDETTPVTTVTFTGEQDGNWFVEYPLVTMESTGGDQIFYSLTGELWEVYTEPFYLEEEGVIGFRYRSLDPNNNVEITKIELVRIDVQDRVHKTLRFSGGVFNVK